VGHSEEKLEQMKEETEDKPCSELPLDKASVALAAKKATPKNIGSKGRSVIWRGLSGKFRRATGFS
jgi:hypothetical protein